MLFTATAAVVPALISPGPTHQEFESICELARQGSTVPFAALAPAGRTAQYLTYASTSASLAGQGRAGCRPGPPPA